MRSRIILLIFLLLTSALYGADGIPVGTSFPVPIALDGGTATTGKALVLDAAGADKPLHVFYVGKDGALTELVYAIKRQDGPAPNPQPNPHPNPQPNPQPNPTPTPKAAYLYLIHETADATPQFNLVQMDTKWKERATSLKIRWVIVDDDNAEKTLPNSVALARKKGLPAVVWLDGQGLATAESCPKTPADMLALVEKLGGSK